MDKLLIPIGILAVIASVACGILGIFRQTGPFDRAKATITQVTVYPQKTGAGGAFISYQYQHLDRTFPGQGRIDFGAQRTLEVGAPIDVFINSRFPEVSFPGNPPQPIAWLASCVVALVAGCAMIFDGYKKRYRNCKGLK